MFPQLLRGSVAGAFASLILLGMTPAGAAERHALLIGATDYPSHVLTGGQKPLSGPRNDVTLMYRTLVDLGLPASNIRVLADGLERADYPHRIEADALPTRDAVLAAFQDLAERTAPGDQVLIYLSGHGSWVPEIDKPGGRTEANGRDEIWLPIDIGMWQAEGQLVENQIMDDEFGALIERLLARQVFVWFVVDACHAGTTSRSAGDDSLIARNADPATALGVPTTLLESAGGDDSDAALPTRPEPAMTIHGGPGRGFVGFYAAMPEQRALEGMAPPGQMGVERRQHGMMTWSLVQAMREGFTHSYETLARRVMAGYWEWGGNSPTPMFEGELAASPFLGTDGERLYGISVRGGEVYVRAGVLDNVGVGSIVELFQQNAPSGSLPYAYCRVTDLSVDEARLELLPSTAERPTEVLPDLARRNGFDSAAEWLADRASTLAVRIIDRAPEFTLRVGAPTAVPVEDGARVSAEERAKAEEIRYRLSRLAAEPSSDQVVAFELVEPGERPDVALRVVGDRLWFAPATAELVTEGPAQSYSLHLNEATDEKLSAALRVIAKSRNLARVAARFADTPLAEAIRVEVALAPGEISPTSGTCPPDIGVEPTSLPGDARSAADLGYTAAEPVRIGNCDRVFISLHNTSERTVDLTPLYIDPWSSVYFLPAYAGSLYGGLRLAPGQRRIVTYTEVTMPMRDAETGAERLTPVGLGRVIFIAVEGDPAAPFGTDFRHLDDHLPISERRAASDPDGLTALLESAASGDGTVRRGSAPEEMRGRVAMLTVPFRTVAPAGR